MAKGRNNSSDASSADSKNEGQTGRPTKYSPGFVAICDEYFDIDPWYVTEVDEVVYRMINKKRTRIEQKEVRKIINPPPTFAGFARKIGVHRDTIHSWATATKTVKGEEKLKYPEFSDALMRAKDNQERIIVENTSLGHYPPVWSIFMSKNMLGWRDVKAVELDGGEDEETKERKPVRIVFNKMSDAAKEDDKKPDKKPPGPGDKPGPNR